MFIDGTYFTSRSSMVDRQECGRLRYLGTDFNGQGYQSVAGKVPLISGDHEHRLMARLLGHFGGLAPIESTNYEQRMEGLDAIDLAVRMLRKEYLEEVTASGIRDLDDEEVQFTIQEQLTMVEGVARGWVYYRLPRLLEEYDVVSIEEQWGWGLGPGIKVPLRMDATLRRKADGLLFILDFKGIPYGDDAWQRTHENSLQTILYITALEELTGEPVGGMMYEGLVRGRFAMDTAKPENSPFSGKRIQQTPYCYGYQNLDGETPIRQAKYTSRKGFKKFRVADEIAGGFITQQEWLDQLIAEDILPELFISMQPVNPPPELRHRIRNQQLQAEQRYVEDLLRLEDLKVRYGPASEEVLAHLDLMAPQNTGRCYKFGQDSRCPFVDAGCLMEGAALSTLPDDEGFKVREPHHDISKLVIPLKRVA